MGSGWGGKRCFEERLTLCSTVAKGKKIHFDGIEILLIDLKSRLITNSTSSADWVQLALQTGQNVII